jgi:hypothetical protein
MWLAGSSLYAVLHPLLNGHVSGALGLAVSLVSGTAFWLSGAAHQFGSIGVASPS